MSHESPCSVPDWLRAALPLETMAEQACCRIHDAAYAEGGTHFDRLEVDLQFATNLLDAGMEPDKVDRYFWGVRQYGGLFWLNGDWPGAAPIHPPERIETA
jgi:hypothetical protein